MTNLEWLMKDKEVLVVALLDRFAKSNGKIINCSHMRCKDCDFYTHDKSCIEIREEWLKAEHKLLYKKGDILVTKDGEIEIVSKEDSTTLSVIASRNIKYIEHGCGYRIYFDNIERKVGNIYDKRRSN